MDENRPAIDGRVRWLTFVAIVLLAAHAVEEWFTGMFNVDPIFRAAARLSSGAPGAAFIAFQAASLVALVLLLVAMQSERARLWLLIALAILCFAELQHVILVFTRRAYYPGSVTSAIIFLFSFIYLRELRAAHRRLQPTSRQR